MNDQLKPPAPAAGVNDDEPNGAIKPPAPAPVPGVSIEEFCTMLYDEARRCCVPLHSNSYTQLLNLPCPDCGCRQLEVNWFEETVLKTRCTGCRRRHPWPIDGKGNYSPPRNT